MSAINKVAVIGAGVMGAGIAAHIANAGVPVVLLDIVPAGAENRNVIAETALAKLEKGEPAAFMSRAAAKLVTPGNIEDHLPLLADCDWIVEAVIERLDVKQALYAKIDAVRKPGSVVSSNTSTIPLAQLTEGLSAAFARDFLVTHFFNPPRYMRLLEVVRSPRTRDDAAAMVSAFCDYKLGKGIVHCNDRPGFIANRLGVFWLQTAVKAAFDLGVEVEEADAIVGKPMGVPKTGVFGLIDLVGLDLMPHINASMAASLPAEDPFQALVQPIPLVERMIADGYTGRKGRGGFYRLNREAGKRKEAIDLATGEYRAERKPEIEAIAAAGRSLTKLLDHDSKHGRYAWAVLGPTLAYAAALVGDAADTVEAIDEAMRLGYNWKYGPFELIDLIGVEQLVIRLEKAEIEIPAILLAADGRPFYRISAGRREAMGLDGEYHAISRAEGVLLLEDVKRIAKPVIKNGSAALWDIGDGVACFEFTSKMNSIDLDIMALLQQSIEVVRNDFKALVIYNDGANFSVGANLGLAMFAANMAAWSQIDNLVKTGQQTVQALRYAPFPVVSAPSGLALGGGCELVLCADAVQAHAETYIGLVEVGVGLIPAWGGCKEMLQRWNTLGGLPKGPMPLLTKVFEIISTATTAKSAAQAKELLFLRPDDGVTMNRDRLLADAKAKALALAADYVPPAPPTFVLPGRSGETALKMAVDSFARQGRATPHDVVVCGRLATALAGGDADVIAALDENAVFDLERNQFLELIRHPDTLARIEHVLETGKPLRN